MSVPIITPSTTTRQQAITDLIESIALEETALSNILDAEGDKIQTVIKMGNVTVQELLAVNNSVQTMINSVSRLEMVLQSKLELFSGALSTTV